MFTEIHISAKNKKYTLKEFYHCVFLIRKALKNNVLHLNQINYVNDQPNRYIHTPKYISLDLSSRSENVDDQTWFLLHSV